MDVVKEDLKSVCLREEFVLQAVNGGGANAKFDVIFLLSSTSSTITPPGVHLETTL